MSSPRERRREQEEQIQRAEILAAAERQFAANGFHKTKISDIAHEAEFGVGTLYKLFESKERLFAELVEQKLEAMQSSLRQAAETQSGALAKLRAVIDTALGSFEEQRTFMRIFLLELGVAPWRLHAPSAERMLARIKEQDDYLASVFQEGIEQGVFKPAAARDYAVAFGGMFKHLLGYRVMDDIPIDPLVDGDFLFNTFVYGALAGAHEQQPARDE